MVSPGQERQFGVPAKYVLLDKFDHGVVDVVLEEFHDHVSHIFAQGYQVLFERPLQRFATRIVRADYDFL